MTDVDKHPYELLAAADDSPDSQFQRFPPFPPDARVIVEAEEILKSKSVRINEVADIVLEDPVASLELLSAANKKFHPNERPAIWSVRTALFRLGSEQTLLLFDDLLARAITISGPVRSEFEHLRFRARRASLIAKTLATEVAPQLIEECQTAGLMSEVGYMFALIRFKERYLRVIDKAPAKGFAYHLEQELRFDLEKFRLDYLGERGFPPSLLFVFDSAIKCKTESQANLRFITQGAEEVRDAIDSNKFERYSPAQELPSKSSLRYLEWPAGGREAAYENLSKLFFSDHLVRQESKPTPPPPVATAAASPKVPVFFVETKVEFIETKDEEFERPLTHFSERSQKVLAALRDSFSVQEDSDELIKSILKILTEGGPFSRASLLKFNRKLGLAEVILPTGVGFSNQVSIVDPLSPVATSNTQIRSFNSDEIIDELSPFGIPAYALSPLNVGDNTRIALYADCGEAGVVPFESRRIFRVAVGLINKALEETPASLSS